MQGDGHTRTRDQYSRCEESLLPGRPVKSTLGISIGLPQWMVYFLEYPSYKWMRHWGYPHDLGNPHL